MLALKCMNDKERKGRLMEEQLLGNRTEKEDIEKEK